MPRNLELADHYKEPDPIVSDKIKDAIAQAVEDSAEFVSAQIETKDGVFPYWVIHSLKEHDVIDRKTRIFTPRMENILAGSRNYTSISKS